MDVCVLLVWQRHKSLISSHGAHSIGTSAVLPHSYQRAEFHLQSVARPTSAARTGFRGLVGDSDGALLARGRSSSGTRQEGERDSRGVSLLWLRHPARVVVPVRRAKRPSPWLSPREDGGRGDWRGGSCLWAVLQRAACLPLLCSAGWSKSARRAGGLRCIRRGRLQAPDPSHPSAVEPVFVPDGCRCAQSLATRFDPQRGRG